jgi:hypothetical protein
VRTMNRVIIGIGAVSVLALGYSAYAANDSYQLELKGSAPAFCNLVRNYHTPLFASQNGATTTSDAQKNISVMFTEFANADGTGQETGGLASLTVYSNAQCTLALKSANGAMKNLVHDGAYRAYEANLYGASERDMVQLNSLAPDTQVGAPLLLDAPAGAGNTSVYIDVHIPVSGILAAGHYQDILTLTLSPPA